MIGLSLYGVVKHNNIVRCPGSGAREGLGFRERAGEGGRSGAVGRQL